jgi:hypothetical protein
MHHAMPAYRPATAPAIRHVAGRGAAAARAVARVQPARQAPPPSVPPARPKAMAAVPRSEGLLVPLNASSGLSPSAALSPDATGAALMNANGSHGLQPRPDVTAAAPNR